MLVEHISHIFFLLVYILITSYKETLQLLWPFNIKLMGKNASIEVIILFLKGIVSVYYITSTVAKIV